MKQVAHHGPTPIGAKKIIEKTTGRIVLEFSDAKELKTSDGKPLRGLEAGGVIGQLYEIPGENIKIEGNRIIIDGQAGTCGMRIRYAWKPYTDANLVNETGLPASTFEIEVVE
jgi:sialate O-acetylesterase